MYNLPFPNAIRFADMFGGSVNHASHLPGICRVAQSTLTEHRSFAYCFQVNLVHRIISLVVLLIALCALTGIGQAASSLVAADASAPCCPLEEPVDDLPLDAPCSTPDCPCSACQVFEVPLLFSFQNALLELPLRQPLSVTSFPAGHGRTVDYPPETA